jgi:oxygen-independent coproporphyrinogen III oxidase
VHVPFCKHHCGYCDFAVVAGKDHAQQLYVEALRCELSSLQETKPVDTIFIGGGTPTYLSAPLLDHLLTSVILWLGSAPEFSIEATPESLTEEKVAVLKSHGVNRISLGVQTFQDHLLKRLERIHNQLEIEKSLDLCLQSFPMVSLDMIFAVPLQTLVEWQSDLQRAISLGVSHISTYGLTYEKGTPLWKKLQRQEVLAQEEDNELAMYEYAMNSLPLAGIEQYEISNFARLGHECRHNQNYWANGSYYGFGLGAVRYLNGRRETNTRSLVDYLRRCLAGEPATQKIDALSKTEEIQGTIFA